ncbi:MAG: hypothetical protein M3291_14585 [Actinomycetota bacterium]|nr:hypothetical protein [Actinomycetota bacterium]
MGASTSLERRSIAVEPGGEATCSVQVRNTGTVVDQFAVEVLGDARSWSEVDPTVVNLLPGEESTAVVRFRPPQSSDVLAGTVPFGIRVSSREDPAGSVVEEGTVEVGVFTHIRVELVPSKARGRRQAKYEVAVDNLGNHPVAVDVDTADPEESLRFRPERTALTVDPGTTAFVALRVRPDERFLRGPDRSHPFQVRVRGAGAEPTVAEGAMVQRPLLPRWLLPALAALVAALIALVVLWFTLFKPTIESAARDVADRQVQQVAATANEAKEQAAQAQEEAGGGAAPGEQAPGEGAPDGGDQQAPPGPEGQPLPEPIAFRLAAEAPVTTDPEDLVFTTRASDLPDDRIFAVSDLVLQNPLGDSGILRILRQEVDGNETILLEVGLDNFRDLDYHFVQPLSFAPGEEIALAVDCQNPPGGRDPCTPAASFSGQLEPVPPAQPEPAQPEPAQPEPDQPEPAQSEG